MKLALAFQTPLHILMQVMSSEELTLWQAFDEQDPISLHHRVDLGAGVVASANINKNIPPGKERVKPSDFMPVMQRQMDAEKPKGMNQHQLKDFMLGQIALQEARKKRAQKQEERVRQARERKNGSRPTRRN